MNKSNDFYKIYSNLINEENNELFYQSTELVDEEQLIKESLGKWAKNVFTKFGKDAVKNEMIKTFNNVINKYQLTPVKQNGETNINLLGKKEGNFIILLDLDPAKDNFKSQQIGVSVLENETKKPVKGIDRKIIKMKHSWTENELTEEINKVLAPARIKLTGNAGNINNLNSQKNEAENKTNSNSSNSSNTNRTNSETIDKNKSFAGFSNQEIQTLLNNEEGNKEQKLSQLKALVSGWKKLSDEEKQAFLKLKKK